MNRRQILVTLLWPLSKLVPYERNPRKNDLAVSRMVASIKEFGFKIPVLARSNGEVVDGHLRIKAAIVLGMKKVPVILCDEWTPAQVKAFRLMVNRSVTWADWDEDLLGLEIIDLQALEYDLSLTGFDSHEVAELLRKAQKPPPGCDEDAVPEPPAQPVTVLGDLWLLGEHRVLCGDSTSVDAAQRVCGATVPDLCFTDPPYGIDVVKISSSGMGKLGGMGGPTPFGGKKSGRVGGDGAVAANWYAPIIGDDTTDTAAGAFSVCTALAIRKMIFWGGNCYAHVLPPSRCWIVWDKNTAPGASYSEFELAWTNMEGRCRMFRHTWSGMVKASEHNTKRVHPTQKPIALAEWAFGELGAESKTVLDLFLGSGSTLIGCEKTERACFGMELSPAYVDVIVYRWQTFTGKQATLDGDGRTIDELKKVRLKKGHK